MPFESILSTTGRTDEYKIYFPVTINVLKEVVFFFDIDYNNNRVSREG